MADIKSFPNNQSTYVGAEWVMRWLHGRTSGVFAADGNAAVSAASGEMAVTVSDGLGWMANSEGNGIVWWNDKEATDGSPLKLTIDTADGVLNRIDRIIVEWKTTNYVDLPEIKVLKGTASSTPTVPALTNNTTLRQISLAKISIPAGTLAITSLLITDERLDPDVCGLVTEAVSADTSVINAQYQAAVEEIETAIAQAWSGAISDGAITTEKIADEAVTEAKLAPALDALVVADQITVKLTISANGSATASVPGMTADHVLDSVQFYTDSNLTTPSSSDLADLSWTPGSGTLAVTVANKAQNCYALLGFSYKPILAEITIS